MAYINMRDVPIEQYKAAIREAVSRARADAKGNTVLEGRLTQQYLDEILAAMAGQSGAELRRKQGVSTQGALKEAATERSVALAGEQRAMEAKAHADNLAKQRIAALILASSTVGAAFLKKHGMPDFFGKDKPKPDDSMPGMKDIDPEDLQTLRDLYDYDAVDALGGGRVSGAPIRGRDPDPALTSLALNRGIEDLAVPAMGDVPQAAIDPGMRKFLEAQELEAERLRELKRQQEIWGTAGLPEGLWGMTGGAI